MKKLANVIITILCVLGIIVELFALYMVGCQQSSDIEVMVFFIAIQITLPNVFILIALIPTKKKKEVSKDEF